MTIPIVRERVCCGQHLPDAGKRLSITRQGTRHRVSYKGWQCGACGLMKHTLSPKAREHWGTQLSSILRKYSENLIDAYLKKNPTPHLETRKDEIIKVFNEAMRNTLEHSKLDAPVHFWIGLHKNGAMLRFDNETEQPIAPGVLLKTTNKELEKRNVPDKKLDEVPNWTDAQIDDWLASVEDKEGPDELRMIGEMGKSITGTGGMGRDISGFADRTLFRVAKGRKKISIYHLWDFNQKR